MMRNPRREQQEEEKETGRLEAFSDGIFAVAITLLVLDIKLPQPGPDQPSLQDQIIGQWPSFLAYFISFATILIMWSIPLHRSQSY